MKGGIEMRSLRSKKAIILVLFIVLVILLLIPKHIIANNEITPQNPKPTAIILTGIMNLDGPDWECVCPKSPWDCRCKVPKK